MKIGDKVRTADPLLADSEELAEWPEIHPDVLARRRGGEEGEIVSFTVSARTGVLRSVIVAHGPRRETAAYSTDEIEMLSVFHAAAGDGEWVIAASPDDAASVFQEYMGAAYVLTEEDPKPSDWKPQPDDEVRAIKSDETGKRETKTNAQWIAAQGRGFLCSGNV